MGDSSPEFRGSLIHIVKIESDVHMLGTTGCTALQKCTAQGLGRIDGVRPERAVKRGQQAPKRIPKKAPFLILPCPPWTPCLGPHKRQALVWGCDSSRGNRARRNKARENSLKPPARHGRQKGGIFWYVIERFAGVRDIAEPVGRQI